MIHKDKDAADDSVGSASHGTENATGARAFATLDLITGKGWRGCFCNIPKLDQANWPANSLVKVENLATGLNHLAYAGFYPTAKQMEKIEEFLAKHSPQEGKLTLVLHRTIALRPTK